MSYDISLYRKGIKNAERIYYDYDGNITYNVCEMLGYTKLYKKDKDMLK